MTVAKEAKEAREDDLESVSIRQSDYSDYNNLGFKYLNVCCLL